MCYDHFGLYIFARLVYRCGAVASYAMAWGSIPGRVEIFNKKEFFHGTRRVGGAELQSLVPVTNIKLNLWLTASKATTLSDGSTTG